MTVTRPRGWADSAARSVSAASIASRMCAVWATRRRPASVSWAERAVRSRSDTPVSFSKAANCCETAEAVWPVAAAVAAIDPWAANS